MPGLRMQPDVAAVRARDVHVVVLEEFLHLGDQLVPTPLSLHPVERLREATGRPAVEDIHSLRIPRIAAPTARSAAAPRRVRTAAAPSRVRTAAAPREPDRISARAP